MANAKFVKTAAAVALGASVITTAVAPGAASAATAFKIKDGKLYKNGKIAKGYVGYKGKLYKNGKLNKGYAKIGTGAKMKLYFNENLKKGFKTANNETLLFKDGVLFKGYKQAGSNERLYKNGNLTTGWEVYTDAEGVKFLYNKGHLYKNLKTATRGGVTNLFENGKVSEGTKVYKDTLYVDGLKSEGTVVFEDTLYTDGVKATQDQVLEDVLYVGGKVAEGTKLFNDTLYVDGKKAEGTVVFDEAVYVDGVKDTEKPVITAEDTTVEYGSKAVDVATLATVKDNSGEEIKAEAKISFDGKAVDAIDTKVPGVYTVAFTAKDKNGNEVTKEVKVTVAEATAAVVESVTGVNATTLEIKFSKAVDKAAAEKAEIKLAGTKLAAGTLSEDGKTLTIVDTSINGVENETLEVPTIKVKDAKDDKDTSAKYVALFTYKDTVAPTVVGATSAIETIDAKDTNKVVVKFSEPVQAAAIAYVNGTNVTVSQDATKKDELVLTLGTAAKAGDALDIKLTNVKDLAGNTIEPNPATVSTVVQGAETSAPVVTAVTTNGLDVTFTYDEEVTTSTLDDTKTFVSADGKSVGTLKAGKLSEDKKSVTYTVELTGDAKVAYDKDGVFAGTLYVQDGLVADLAGNKSVASTQSLTLTADKVAPTVVTSEVKDGKLVLTFSEEVEASTTLKVTTSKYNAATGKTDAAKEATFNVSTEDKKVVTIDLPAALTEDATYKVNFAEGTFTDAAKNEVAAYATQVVVPKAETVEAKDTQAPTITLSNATDEVLTVTDGNYTIFYKVKDEAKTDEEASALDFTSIRNVANYTLAGKALPAGTEITTDADDTKATEAIVTITIPKTAVKENIEGFLTVTGIKDVKGNTVTSIEATTGKLTLVEGVAPELTSAVVNADNSITVAFSEEINDAATLATDVVVTADDKEVAGVFTAGTGSDAGKYVFTATDAAAIKDAKTLTVSTAKTTTTTDKADNKLVAEKVITLK